MNNLTYWLNKLFFKQPALSVHSTTNLKLTLNLYKISLKNLEQFGYSLILTFALSLGLS